MLQAGGRGAPRIRRESNERERAVSNVPPRAVAHPSPLRHSTATKPGPAPAPAAIEAPEPETDARRLEQRRKQIDMGKNTRGYAAYTAAVPR